MKDKVTTATRAAEMIESGMHLGIGAGMEANPMPVIREIIKKGVHDLTLTPVLTGGYVADLLIGAGCVTRVQFPQIVLDEFGLAPNFRKYAQAGKLILHETMCPALLLALQAGACGLPFTPVIGFLNTDYMKIRKDFVVMKDPFTGHEYVVVPPIVPDVAIVHGPLGDRFGGLVLDSARNDRLLAMAAKKTIAVVEKLVEPDQVLPGKHGVYTSGIHVDAVVQAPHGAHPTACRDYYPTDDLHIMSYVQAAGNENTFQEYLEQYILGPADHGEYLRRVGVEVKES